MSNQGHNASGRNSAGRTGAGRHGSRGESRGRSREGAAGSRAAALYLVLHADAAAMPRIAMLRSALNGPVGLNVQSVLLLPPVGGRLDAGASPLVEALQAAGIAALIGQDARLARTLKADGVHLAWSATIADDFATARDILGTRAIVGAEAGGSRHDAMVLAEAGTDYVGFRADDGGTSTTASGDPLQVRYPRDDMVDWWGEIFEVPCVAFDARDAADAEALAAAGADFIGIALPPGLAVADCRQLVEDCAIAVGRVSSERSSARGG